MSAPTIKAVLFDLDDTLIATSQADVEAYREVQQLCCSRVEDLDGLRLLADWQAAFTVAPWDPSGQVEVEAWRTSLWLQALTNQGVAQPELAAEAQACFRSARLQRMQFMDGVHELVRSLQRQGYVVGIITNGHHTVQRDKLAAIQAEALFHPDLIVVGGEEELAGRHQKPHPGIFYKACALVGCLPAEAVMVGDSLSADVGGGNAAGLAATVWVSPELKAPPVGGPQPTYSVRSVLELPAVLQQLQGGQAAA